MEKWKTTISELVLNFKGALFSIIPWLEKSKIPFKEGESYDDWDSIAAVLFKTMIVDSIRFSDLSITNSQFAEYDLHYKSYQGLNFLLCNTETETNNFQVFVSFNVEDNFETINVCIVDKESLQVCSEGKIPVSDVTFFLYNEIPIEHIVIEI